MRARHVGERDADSGTDVVLLAGDDERPLERLDQAPGDGEGGIGGFEVVAEQRELVAAEASQRLGGAQRDLQPAGHRREQLVTGGVAEGVVDRLEVVEVDEEDGDRLVAAHQPGEGVLQPIEEQDAVGQAGERVVQRAMLGLALGARAVDRRRDDVRDRLEELDLLVGERAPARAVDAEDAVRALVTANGDGDAAEDPMVVQEPVAAEAVIR